jgi:hypothetical protein
MPHPLPATIPVRARAVLACASSVGTGRSLRWPAGIAAAGNAGVYRASGSSRVSPGQPTGTGRRWRPPRVRPGDV